MSHFDRALRAQFYLTNQRDCPYLDGRLERKLFTTLMQSDSARLHDELAQHGFRRSQNIVYRPACAACAACVSTRVCAPDFSPTRSQKRVMRRNTDLVRRIEPAIATEPQYRLFERYLDQRHADGGMADMEIEDFAAMIEETPIRTKVVEYHAPAATADNAKADGASGLVAACLTDQLHDGLSLVYSFFEPSLARRSLGQFIILDHIAQAAEMELSYVYLGYWVTGSKKMEYKIQFRPCEILQGDRWSRVEV